MEYLSDDYKERPNQHKNLHKLCDKKRHLIVSLTESERKLRQQHDQDLPMERKPL